LKKSVSSNYIIPKFGFGHKNRLDKLLQRSVCESIVFRYSFGDNIILRNNAARRSAADSRLSYFMINSYPAPIGSGSCVEFSSVCCSENVA
jgi:hypothetical protein